MKQKDTGKKKQKKNKVKKIDGVLAARLRYFCVLSGVLLICLVIIGIGMFAYLKSSSRAYRQQYAEELKNGMEDAKDNCINILKELEADDEMLESIKTRYENAMANEDILQQYYLVDGIIDSSISDAVQLINAKAYEEVQRYGEGYKRDRGDYIVELRDIQAELKTVKEQLSGIDTSKYY